MSTSRIFLKNGRPVIEYNGKVISPAKHSDPLTFKTKTEWIDRCKDFADAGVHIQTIAPGRTNDWFATGFWTDENQYNDNEDGTQYSLNEQAEKLINIDKDVLFFVRFNDNFPGEWREKNPDCLDQIEGHLCGTIPSQASKKALSDLNKYISTLINYCENSEWADRVLGYLYFPLGEGISLYSLTNQLFDTSEIMNQEFNKHLIDKYKTIGKLNEKYESNFLSFEELKTPTQAQWEKAIEGEFQIVVSKSYNHFKDYFKFQKTLYYEWFKGISDNVQATLGKNKKIFGIDFAKNIMTGWQGCVAFVGAVDDKKNIDVLLASGSIGISDLLEIESFDMLITPSDYTARTLGLSFDSEGVNDSLLLYNKVMLAENDSRTYIHDSDFDTQGAFKNDDEVRQGTLRNFSWGLSKGQFVYWMNVGQGFFRDDNVIKATTDDIVGILEKSKDWGHVETPHAVALIIDDTACLCENSTCDYQNLASIWQRLSGLSNCGIPYRVYMFSDLYKENMPSYKCYIFPNLFEVDEKKENILKQKVFKDGQMSIFGPLTGVYTENGYSAQKATSLFGVDMEIIEKQTMHRVCINGSNEIAQKIPSSVYGDSLVYGPLLLPKLKAFENSTASPIGSAISFWGQNREGLFVNDFKTHKIAYSFAMPIPPEVIRELAREGGCNVYSEQNDLIMASETFLAIHTTKSGKKTIKLPRKCKVVDLLDDKVIYENSDIIEVTMKSPETKMYLLGE
jgi:hypothetical protein